MWRVVEKGVEDLVEIGFTVVGYPEPLGGGLYDYVWSKGNGGVNLSVLEDGWV
jgi:hypothetical protein